ncbi:MAG: carbohydrate binding family 9 domain-containing protein [Prolixibacteraceae bacterium]|nr:carbohydrate binding family 9 domain-containing protein [Prolixibacteraceae bacterium]
MKKVLTPLSFLFIAICVFPQNNDSLVINNPALRTYTTHRLTTPPPVVDGKLDDECWKNEYWDGDFTQWIPKEGAEPSEETTFNILYDNKNLYIAIRSHESDLSKITKRLSRRDVFSGDCVGVDFDSYHDHRTGFEFNVTLAGQKIDNILTNPMNADISWDAVWLAKTGMEDSAWVAEIEIPLSQLRYSKDKEQIWGMHIWRWIDRLQEESDWELQTSTGPGMLYQFGHLKGISDLPASKRIELMPYILGAIRTVEKNSLDPYTKNGFQAFGYPGIDAKIGLSSNFTANVTINPDFGQVEADPSVMNLTAFETFYNEKRPFFLEGKNIFNFEFNDITIFYSRRIGNAPSYRPVLAENEYMKYPVSTSILSAVKVSGKSSKGLSVGILQSITNNEKALISDGTAERKVVVEPLTSYTVARIQQDFNEGNTILGGILTSKNRINNDSTFLFMNKDAIAGGIDFLHQWKDKEFYLNAKLIGSTIQGSRDAISILQKSSARYYQRPDADHLEVDNMLTNLSGYGGSLKIGKGSKGLWRYSTAVTVMSPGLELNDMGYMSIADQLINTNSISYFINKPVGIMRSFNFSFSNSNFWNTDFQYLYTHFNSFLSFQFLNRWTLETHMCNFTNTLDMQLLRGGSGMIKPAKTHANIKIGSDYSKNTAFTFYALYEKGGKEYLDYFSFNPSFTVQPLSTLKFTLSIDYSNNDNELQYVNSRSTEYNSLNDQRILGRIKQETLGATLRVDYHIKPEISLQFYGSPFISTGTYSSFKIADNPLADEYSNRFTAINPVLSNQNTYNIGSVYFNNPDFCFSEFRSNLVFRWEYLPGSTIYLVWANESSINKSVSGSKIGDAFKNLGEASSINTFLLKINYWFAL